MSFVKRMMEEREERRGIVTEIAVDSGVLARCEFHGELYDPLNGDNTPAYDLGAEKLSAGELGSSFASIDGLKEEIDAAVNDAGMECHSCEKAKSD